MKVKKTFHQFPKPFWALLGASFIDRLGGALLLPFFALYATSRFAGGLAVVGTLFAIFAVAHALGSLLGGALTDRLGRRRLIIVGLVGSGLSSFGLGFVGDLTLFYGLVFLAGLFGSSAGPAQSAMVADLLPPAQRQEGYALQRVQLNLAVTIGPALGGLLAGGSYLYLFAADALTSLVTALLIYRFLPESMPGLAEKAPATSHSLLADYRPVLHDRLYLAFLLLGMLILFIYMQTTTTLPVYLRDVHGIPAQGYGLLISLNAGLVVVCQLWLTRRFGGLPPLHLLALGALFIGLGVGLFGLAAGYPLLIAAVVLFTIGEMIMAPVAPAIVTELAPATLRGRYLAAFELSMSVPAALAPALAGAALLRFDPRLVWLTAVPLGLLAASGSLLLARQWRQRHRPLLAAASAG